MHTNKLKKEQIFPSMRGCLIKLPTDEDPDEGVKVINRISVSTNIRFIIKSR